MDKSTWNLERIPMKLFNLRTYRKFGIMQTSSESLSSKTEVALTLG
ncbi:hypothetical protein T09_4331 [Trichinella sp. T9]|nr:hypothetical protein T09_4331 [Trichinella sp. T9]